MYVNIRIYIYIHVCKGTYNKSFRQLLYFTFFNTNVYKIMNTHTHTKYIYTHIHNHLSLLKRVS